MTQLILFIATILFTLAYPAQSLALGNFFSKSSFKKSGIAQSSCPDSALSASREIYEVSVLNLISSEVKAYCQKEREQIFKNCFCSSEDQMERTVVTLLPSVKKSFEEKKRLSGAKQVLDVNLRLIRMIIPIDRALRYDDRGDLRSWYQTIKALKGTEVTEETCRRGTQFLAAYVGARLLGKGLQLGEGPIANLAKTNLQQEVGKVIYLSENGSLAYTTVTPKEFMDVFSKVQAEKSTLLKARSLAEMEDIFQKGGRFYLASGNEGVNAKAGFVVSGNGEIFSAFNTTRNKLQSVQVLREAKKLGIKKLVCMDNVADPRSSPCALYRLVMRSVPGMREVESIPMTRTERPDLGAIPDEAFKDLRKVSFTFED